MAMAAEQAAASLFRFMDWSNPANSPRTIPLPANSLVFDIETTGLDPRSSAVIEAAIHRIGGGTKRWAITPYIGGKRVETAGLLTVASDWFRDRHGKLFSWVGQDPQQVKPGRFIEELVPTLRGNTIWIQNAPFETRHIAQVLEHHGTPEQLSAFRRMMETRPLSPAAQRKLLFVTGQEVQAARQTAYQTKDWMPVFEEYVRSASRKTGATRVRDIQDVTRAIFSESQRMGIMKQTGVFAGSSINALSLAYGLPSEVHRAEADVLREGTLLKKLWRSASGLSNARNRGLWGDAAFLFSNAHKEDLTALKRINVITEEVRTKNLLRNLAEAKLHFEFNANPDWQGVTDKFKTFMAPMETYEGKSVLQRINYSAKKVPADYEEAVKLLTSETLLGRGMSHKVKEAVTQVADSRESQLRKLVHVPLALEQQHNEKLLQMMNKAGKFSNWDAARILFAKHPIKMGGAALAGFYLTGLALDTVTRRTPRAATEGDSHIDWSGLEPYGVGSDMRRYSTDFGSGWKGLLEGIAKRNVSPKVSARAWLSRDNLNALGADLERRLQTAMKSAETADWYTATGMIRKDALSYSREMPVAMRLEGIESPIVQRPMAEFLAGADPAQAASRGVLFQGHRDYNVVQGLGHGRISIKDFSSPWTGLRPTAARMARQFVGPRFRFSGVRRDLKPADIAQQIETYQYKGAFSTAKPHKMRGWNSFREYADAVLFGRASTVSGMPDRGMSKHMRKTTGFGSPWTRLGTTIGAIGDMWRSIGKGAGEVRGAAEYMGMVSSEILRKDIESIARYSKVFGGLGIFGTKNAVKALKDYGLAGSGKEALDLLRKGSWKHVGSSKWLYVQDLSPGANAAVGVVVGAKSGKLGVWKSLIEKDFATDITAPRQLFPFKYKEFKDTEAHRAFRKRFTSLKKAIPDPFERYAQALDPEEMAVEADLAYIRQWQKQMAVLEKEQPLKTVQDALQREITMQRAAHKANSGMVPKVWAAGTTEFVQEYGGVPLSRYIERVKRGDIPVRDEFGELILQSKLENEQLAAIQGRVRQYIDETLEQGGVFNWDLSLSNIVVNPRTFEPMIIDMGAATRISGIHGASGETMKMYAADYGENVMKRLFHNLHGPKEAAKQVMLAQDHIAAATARSPSVRSAVNRSAVTAEEALVALSEKSVSDRIRSNRRAHMSAGIQMEASKTLFRSPIGHNRGGG
jgi:hypothetical protein